MEWKLFRVDKDWKFILRRAASMWVLYAILLLTLGQTLVTIGWEHGLIAFRWPWLYPLLVGLLSAFLGVARIMSQEGFSNGRSY